MPRPAPIHVGPYRATPIRARGDLWYWKVTEGGARGRDVSALLPSRWADEMNTPLCPLLMQARASIPWATGGDPAEAAKPVGGAPWVEYPEPAKAPGVACVGSCCAAWVGVYIEGRGSSQREGRCGMAHGDAQSFTDPATRAT